MKWPWRLIHRKLKPNTNGHAAKQAAAEAKRRLDYERGRVDTYTREIRHITGGNR